MRKQHLALQTVILGLLLVTLSSMPVEAQQAEHMETLGQDISVNVPANWMRVAGELRNGRELRAMKDRMVQARMLTITEPRKNHTEALRRLQEIAAEVKAPVQHPQVAGWPAIHRLRHRRKRA